MHRWKTILWMPHERRRFPLKRSNDNLSVKDKIDTSSTEGRMNPITARWGIRGMDDFTVEELAQLHQKLEGWIHQRAHDPERTRRRPWVRKPKTAHPA
jgi:hypothetical protein